jgi:hypothetical protein
MHECTSQINNLLSTFVGNGRFHMYRKVLFFFHFRFVWKQDLQLAENMFRYMSTLSVVLYCARTFDNVNNIYSAVYGCTVHIVSHWILCCVGKGGMACFQQSSHPECFLSLASKHWRSLNCSSSHLTHFLIYRIVRCGFHNM